MEHVVKTVSDQFKLGLGELSDGVKMLYEPESAPLKKIPVTDVVIESGPRRFGTYLEPVLDPGTGQSHERFGMTVEVDSSKMDLQEVQEESARKMVLEQLRKRFENVTLADGATLASKMDFSDQVPEKNKPIKEQLADARKKIEEGLAQAGDAVPQDVKNLLLHAKTFSDSESSVFGFDSSTMTFDNVVNTRLSINNKGSGEKSNAAVTEENILARKDAILNNIREEALAIHAKAGASPEDMAKFKTEMDHLDLQASLSGDSDIQIQFGTKKQNPDTGDRFTVDPAPELAKFSKENLQHIINDSLLFKGEGADKVAHLIAGDNDVRRLLEQYKDTSPALAEAAQNPALSKGGRWGEVEIGLDGNKDDKSTPKPIQPTITIDTSYANGKRNNNIHVDVDLPTEITTGQLMMALAGVQIADQKATSRLHESRAAAANEDRARGVA